jgi:hypothetical protein
MLSDGFAQHGCLSNERQKTLTNSGVTDGYGKLNEDTDFRRQVAEQAGLGFKLPAFEEGLTRPPVASISPGAT